ncbi:MAG: N-acetyl-gamma-glutamyl-phosphate reductase, partial [Planctomycetes bacterium]|nr:N-acetyl-gamma-glutamyl-phosphate reductase [Planctomycetota bacterium]
MKKKVCIAGVSGYIGAQLYRILLNHPEIEIADLFGAESAGQKIGDIYPSLTKYGQMTIKQLSTLNWLNYDIVFSALPNGETSKYWDLFKNSRLFIDTSADFRVKAADLFSKYYPDQTYSVASKNFVYGLPELFRSRIREAKCIAVPGCFATSIILGLAPIFAADLNDGGVFVTSVTGSSGSGSKPKDKTHHPVRNDSYFGYEPLNHRHTAEIMEAVEARFNQSPKIAFQAHSGPFVRGIHTTILFQSANGRDIFAAVKEFYKNEKFIFY